MKIYFAGSIRGGRAKVADYKRIIGFLEENHEVLTEHISDSSITSTGENLSEFEIFNRDLKMIIESDIIVAEVTIPSLGVGYEVGIAESLKKPIYCLFDTIESENKLSSMIKGNPYVKLIQYINIEDLLEKLNKIIDN